MSSKKRTVAAIALAGLGAFLLALALTIPVQASPTLEDGASSSCYSCHVNRYWLFDEGKWYCACAKRVERCTACHLGDPNAYDEDVAHAGLVANPLVDTKTYCGQCHPNDYQQMVDQFVEMTGAQPPAEKIVAVYHPSGQDASPHEEISILADTRPKWQVVLGLALTVAAILVVGGFSIWTYVVKKAKTE